MLNSKHMLSPWSYWLSVLALLLSLVLGGMPAAAAELTLEQAVAQVRRETGGRILAAETVQENGRRVHRIKVLTPERSVRTLRVEVGNGR